MSTALVSRPRLHPEVKIVRREVRGEVHYVVREPTESKYFQFDEVVVTLMRLMDGERTPEEIAVEAEGTLGTPLSPGVVADFAQRLKRLGIVERTPAEQHLMMQERLRKMRKIRSKQRTHGSILRLQFSFGDPDVWFGSLARTLAWMWTPRFVVASIACFGVFLAVTALRWDEFAVRAVDLYTLNGIGPADIGLLILVTTVVTLIHELGHGLTTKALGGEVHDWGLMLFYFSPAAYCETSDAWTFVKRSHRLWTTFAGPWIALLVATAGGVVWAVTEPGTLVSSIAFLTFLMGGLLSIFTNLNPLIPLDGYYALADWLEIPRLRTNAFEYWGWVLKRHLLAMDVREPAVTPRERRIYLLYGSLAFAYTIFTSVVGLLWLVLIFGKFIGPWIWVLVVWMGVKMARKQAGRAKSMALAARTRWQAGFLAGPRAGVLAIVAVAVVALPFVLPWTYRAAGEFTVEAAPPAPVRAEVDGILDRLFVAEGDTVAAGAPLAVLWNPELESTWIDRRAEASRLAVRRARAEATGRLADAAEAAAARTELDRELEILEARRERLTLRAPVAGVIVGYRLGERVGARIDEGAELFTIASLDRRLARVRVPVKRADELAAGQPAGLRLRARPDLEFRAAVAAVAPAAVDGAVEAIVYLPAGEWNPPPGLTGVAKIATRRVTVAQAIGRAWRHTVRIDLWL